MKTCYWLKCSVYMALLVCLLFMAKSIYQDNQFKNELAILQLELMTLDVEIALLTLEKLNSEK